MYPNIVIFLSDDQGWGDLSINGNTNLSTPNIDQIGKRGARFDKFYVQPVCSPTRAELLTGRYHPRAGVFGTSEGGERIALDETTLADIFKKAGYVTGAFGKWHSGMQYPYHPNARGFEEFYGFCSGHWGDYFSPPLEHNGLMINGNGFTADDFTDKALAFIEKHKQSPFLVYLPFNTPHSPMQVPDEDWQRFKDKPLTMQAADPTKENHTFTRAALAMCENIDWNVGRMMQQLRRLGLEENTIVLYFNDNGPNAIRWNGGMKGIKGTTDEGGVRSPLLIQYPKSIKADTRITSVAGAIDLLPTLVDLAGIKADFSKALDGISLKPVLMGSPITTPRMIFAHWNGRISVRTDRYRLDPTGKLYDMEVDFGQTTDVAAQQPAIHAQFIASVARWKSEVFGVNYAKNLPFTVGHPKATWTELPARDAHGRGGIQRSNHHPNSTFFTNWTSPNDAIEWDIEVLASGDFEAEIYYTCRPQDVGATFQLVFGDEKLASQITEAHHPPLRGMEHDKIVRIESYVKDFKPLKMGTIHLQKGRGKLVLQALQLRGEQVMDFRTLRLKRVGEGRVKSGKLKVKREKW